MPVSRLDTRRPASDDNQTVVLQHEEPAYKFKEKFNYSKPDPAHIETDYQNFFTPVVNEQERMLRGGSATKINLPHYLNVLHENIGNKGGSRMLNKQIGVQSSRGRVNVIEATTVTHKVLGAGNHLRYFSEEFKILLNHKNPWNSKVEYKPAAAKEAFKYDIPSAPKSIQDTFLKLVKEATVNSYKHTSLLRGLADFRNW